MDILQQHLSCLDNRLSIQNGTRSDHNLKEHSPTTTISATAAAAASRLPYTGEEDVIIKSNNNFKIQQQHQQVAPNFYPNNTLIVDLNKCHSNISNFFCWWPTTTSTPQQQSSPATTTTTTSNSTQTKRSSLLLSSKWLTNIRCWPLQTGRGRRKLTSYNDHHSATIKSRRYSFLMPEPLLRTNAKLKLEDYDKALSVLTSDVRYQLHLLLYSRVQLIWLLLSSILCILAPLLLFAKLESFIILCSSLVWLSSQVIGAFVSAQVRHKLDQMLEKSVAQVNTFFMDYNLMLGVINVGSLLLKAKLIIPMLYFDTSQCREQIESIISIDSRKDADGNNDNNKHILDYSKIDLPLTKPNTMALAQSQLAKKIVLRYSQRWISYFDKRKLMFTDDQVKPRHLSTGKCLCQFIEEHFKNNNNNKSNTVITTKSKVIKVKSSSPNNQSQHNISSYANNKPSILILNGKKQQQQNGDDEVVVERVVKPQVMRKYAQMAPTIPTLSRLVSLEEKKNSTSTNHQHVKINMEPNQQSNLVNNSTINHLHQSNGCQANGFAKYLWSSVPTSQLVAATAVPTTTTQQQLIDDTSNDYQVSTKAKTEHNNNNNYSSPMPFEQQVPPPTADVSVDLSGQLLGNGDDLVRKLRLLLEMRKNDLQGLDGTLFSAAMYKVSNHFNGLLDGLDHHNCDNNDDLHHNVVHETRDHTFQSDTNTTSTSTTTTSTTSQRASRHSHSETPERKFFSNQRDGLFFFSSNNAKKSHQQQQQATRTNHILEIC